MAAILARVKKGVGKNGNSQKTKKKEEKGMDGFCEGERNSGGP